jgi:tRNA U38,U39,U40 pseudouridine synthase TruA
MNLRRDIPSKYLQARSWDAASGFWTQLLKSPTQECFPPFVLGDYGCEEGMMGHKDGECYGVADLGAVYRCGFSEYCSKSPQLTRKRNFAMRVGYVGSAFKGWQSLGDLSIPTAEDHVKRALGTKVRSTAGRTDKGVSAVSQVINFSTTDLSMTAQQWMERFRADESCRGGLLAAYECARVPKSFSARGSATWRRYLYLFPVNVASDGSIDVDVAFVDSCLSRLEGKKLPYNAFAYGETRVAGLGLQDICELFRARATLVGLGTNITDKKHRLPSFGLHDPFINFPEAKTGSQMPFRVSNELLVSDSSETEHSGDINSAAEDETSGMHSSTCALCIELVGSRFLRRMVRIIVATAIRESLRPVGERDVNALPSIALGGERESSAYAVPGEPLSLAGVGFPVDDLANFKQRPTNPEKVKKRAEEILIAKREGLFNDHCF